MAIDSDYVQQMATQLAQYDIQAAQARATRSQTKYNTELKAVSDLKSALSTFTSAVKGLKSTTGKTDSMLINSATFSSEGYATASVGASAVSGSYDFFVKQLASKDQMALQGLTDADLGSGSLTIGQGSDSFSIDMSSITSLDGLAKAINDATDNSGVKATLVRSNGQVNLVLTSEETGADQAISIGSTNSTVQTAIDGRKQLSSAKDAIVYLGGQSGVELTNSSNTFDDAIAGVSLTFTKVTGPDDELLTLDVGQDTSATKDKLQKFIDAFNTLMTSIGSLTSSGSDTTARGVLAGDAGVMAIKSVVNNLIRTEFGGTSLINFGVSASSSGKLTLDTTAFEKAIGNDPDGFETLFTGKGNLIDSLDSSLKIYTSASTGMLTTRVNSLNERLSKINEDFETLQLRYDSSYSRYLKQYTNLMQVMTSMEQTTGLFV
ncbi:flagellar hook protein FliD [Pseudomonas alcaligenes]|uniref:Flagellar hook-associated protein 2 n=1 Tax=Aquipseudomonas alcaligenes TaxID=43263 RepID=A0ABR7RWW9_AQUAC|nr:flagellar filament capping protein FliD [Pseudomonas alcaligenes]MBC9249835.1 flagellar hook protein FliD [Pseudomonas alcaligenes]